LKSVDYSTDKINLRFLEKDETCDRAIITVPLGILKGGTIGFNPALPTSFSNSVHRLGSGVLDKLVLKFNEVFWDAHCDWFNYISQEDRPYNWTQTLNLHKFTGAPILVMFNCEGSAYHFASYTDEEILNSGLEVLKLTFPNKKNIRDSVVSHIRTNWTKDPYARMSYTYLGKDASPADCAEIAKPIDGKLYFAGEHTHFEFLGTIHAAYMSGIKAAERLIGDMVQNLFLLAFLITVVSRLHI
jgi:monoamine oxidase